MKKYAFIWFIAPLFRGLDQRVWADPQNGNPVGCLVRRIGEPVTTNFLAHATAPVPLSAADSRTLTWNSDTGTYDAR
jgi:hypothetical protein